jgi:hypothetical protein
VDSSQNVYVVDGNQGYSEYGYIRTITPAGQVSTPYSVNGNYGYFHGDPAITGFALARAGVYYSIDYNSNYFFDIFPLGTQFYGPGIDVFLNNVYVKALAVDSANHFIMLMLQATLTTWRRVERPRWLGASEPGP